MSVLFGGGSKSPPPAPAPPSGPDADAQAEAERRKKVEQAQRRAQRGGRASTRVAGSRLAQEEQEGRAKKKLGIE